MYAPNRFISVSMLILRTSIWINYKSGAAILLNIFYAHRQPKKFYNNFIFMFIDRKDKLAYRSKWLKWNTHDTLIPESYREPCVIHFSHFDRYFALHSCVSSAIQQHLLQMVKNIWKSYIYIYISHIILLYETLQMIDRKKNEKKAEKKSVFLPNLS